jgi:CBS domain-containing protein
MGPESPITVDESVHVLQPVAADVMSSQTQSCSSFSTVIEAVLIFKDEGRGVVPVVEEGKAQGIVTARDIALAIANHADLTAQPVSEIMTTEVVQVLNDTPLEQVVGAFLLNGVRHLIVVNGQGDYLGIIGWTDLIPYLTYRTDRGVAALAV